MSSLASGEGSIKGEPESQAESSVETSESLLIREAGRRDAAVGTNTGSSSLSVFNPSSPEAPGKDSCTMYNNWARACPLTGLLVTLSAHAA